MARYQPSSNSRNTMVSVVCPLYNYLITGVKSTLYLLNNIPVK